MDRSHLTKTAFQSVFFLSSEIDTALIPIDKIKWVAWLPMVLFTLDDKILHVIVIKCERTLNYVVTHAHSYILTFFVFKSDLDEAEEDFIGCAQDAGCLNKTDDIISEVEKLCEYNLFWVLHKKCEKTTLNHKIDLESALRFTFSQIYFWQTYSFKVVFFSKITHLWSFDRKEQNRTF